MPAGAVDWKIFMNLNTHSNVAEARPMSIAQARAELSRKGVTIREWADANGVKRATAYNLLCGRLTGNRGEAHRAAVLLGVKLGEA